MTDWLTMTAADLGRGIAGGKIDPVDLVDTFLETIAAHPYGERIYARTTPERARAEAIAARDRARNGNRRGTLDGVPASWKDLFDTAGTATEAGSRLLAGRVPFEDAQVVENAFQKGLVCLGKTHLSELAFSGLGLNPVTATPPNVHDPEALPGGSSSGAAASVAHCLAPLAIGSDTAGSVRIPAAWNDLVGLKTTHGLLPGSGIVPLCPKFDTVGPITRSVEDAALSLSAIGGPAAKLGGASLEGSSFIVLEGTVQTELDPGVGEAFERSLRKLEKSGSKLRRAKLPSVENVFDLSALFAPEAYGTWASTIEANPDVMFARILERFRGGQEMRAADYVAGRQRLEALRAEYLRAVDGCDAVLLPTCAILPPNAAHLLADGEAYTRANLLALRNTRVGNLLGLCGLTLPTGTPSVGLLIQGAPAAEARVLAIGAAAEMVLT